jgi:class 3 adenylate cyclase
MAAGGLYASCKIAAKNVILAGLEMLLFMKSRKTELQKKNKPYFEMRVGIHTGPVVAGIVGVKKFQYDIWGDTVNIANRMERSGEIGRLNISETTYNLIKDDPEFGFEYRGKILAKNKGELDMYFIDVVSHYTLPS